MKITLFYGKRPSFFVASLDEARQLTLEKRGRMSVHQFGGALVTDDNGGFVARISYNGRVWADEGFSQEIVFPS